MSGLSHFVTRRQNRSRQGLLVVSLASWALRIKRRRNGRKGTGARSGLEPAGESLIPLYMNENMTPKTQRLSSSQSECWRETHKNKRDWETEGGKMARKQPACIHPSPCLFLRSVPLPFNISPSSRVGQDNISQLVRNATAQRASQQRAASLLGFRLSRFLLLVQNGTGCAVSRCTQILYSTCACGGSPRYAAQQLNPVQFTLLSLLQRARTEQVFE
ncbi:predicted protein [Histoplasma capsulatum G186AR]|uniref:Uncharacterized protein n=1 Tax=Ajellomyces capsulatus (strain G186AR / H82 / ATCC MYA-2454 / RMSCC 2432) TaxID=447093 RepID=C0NMC4_AJECG|nr:uncharacterized protein HCBG_04654 [Histoplasma capsulatum G186AR]EEH07775.1 predicted protein [Histoplasma capsulatum G186AR]